MFWKTQWACISVRDLTFSCIRGRFRKAPSYWISSGLRRSRHVQYCSQLRMPKYLPDCSHQIDVENHNRVLLEQLQCSEAESHVNNQDKENVLTYPEDDRMESMDVLC